MDVIWNIWFDFPRGTLNRLSFDACMDMTRLALKHGFDFEEAVPYSHVLASPLFLTNRCCWFDSNSTLPTEILEFLLNTGYDMEQRGRDGLTPLLFAAAQHVPHIIKSLRLFIERGANLHATDFDGQGVLHCALAHPRGYVDDSGTLVDFYRDVRADSNAWFSLDTEDKRHESDYDDDGLDPGPLLADAAANAYSIDYVFCEISDGVLEEIRNPSQVLKKRTRFRLLTLLQLGCDPNVVDREGLSPSDLAIQRGLWPQWSWALLNAGYIADGQNGWTKRSLFEGVGARGRIDGEIL